nr:hypothetical protein [uncultured Limnohabitans sp.]
MNRVFGLVLLILSSFNFSNALGMEFQGHERTLIMSGAVVTGDLVKLKNILQETPTIQHVVLRNSWGGDAWTGYRVGEIFRDQRIETSVSGYCVSSCSRMFLGGIKRYFSYDYSPEKTFVGFHGHYNNEGQLNSKSVQDQGLFRWIVKHSDGKADEVLVNQWINIAIAQGMVAFMPQRKAELPMTYFCKGTESKRPLGCEALQTNALTRGVITDLSLKPSPDQVQLRQTFMPAPSASGYATADEIGKVPLDLKAGIDNYQKYLNAMTPKAFAVAPDRQFWAWNTGDEESVKSALSRCAERAKQACLLYAIDETVVYSTPLTNTTNQ